MEEEPIEERKDPLLTTKEIKEKGLEIVEEEEKERVKILDGKIDVVKDLPKEEKFDDLINELGLEEVKDKIEGVDEDEQ